MLRLDLHIHTCFSKDSAAPIASVVQRIQLKGLGPVAITDHEDIQGALEVQRVAPFPVIIGEEIKFGPGLCQTTQGACVSVPGGGPWC